jgi:translation elongation factor EF-4
VTAAGGKDSVVDFELPGQADLEISFAQVGNHVLALYENGNSLLACEGNVLVDCHASKGVQQSTYTLKKLPAKKYHMVIDADKGGAEGGVVLQLVGTPNP